MSADQKGDMKVQDDLLEADGVSSAGMQMQMERVYVHASMHMHIFHF